MAENVAIIEQLYADFATGEIAAVLAAFSERIEWYQAEGNPYRQDLPAVGHQQVQAQVFARLPQEFDDFSIRVVRIVGLGDTVLAEVWYAATCKSTGLSMDAQAAHVWDLQDNLVVRFQQYVDTAQWRAVFGVAS